MNQDVEDVMKLDNQIRNLVKSKSISRELLKWILEV